MLTVFSLPQVMTTRDLSRAVTDGNVQACYMYAVFLRVLYTTQPVHAHHSIRSISFYQVQSTNINRLRPAPNTHRQKSSVRRLITASLDMLCLNLVSLMCMHASTQEAREILDRGRVHPDCFINKVRIEHPSGLHCSPLCPCERLCRVRDEY